MNIFVLYGVAVGIWLASLGASGMAMRWSKRAFWPALGLAAGALLASYIGFTRFQLRYTELINSRVQWNLDSKQFFMLSLLVAGVAVVWVLWQGRRVLVAKTGKRA